MGVVIKLINANSTFSEKRGPSEIVDRLRKVFHFLGKTE